MKTIQKIIPLSFIAIFSFSCGQKNRPNNEVKMPTTEESIQAGKSMARQEDGDITAYVKR